MHRSGRGILFPLIVPAPITAFPQNLVVNPSFEITASNCSNFGGEGFFTDLVGSWDNASNNAAGDSCSSPDLFSACNLLLGMPAPTHMPNSMLGFQYSRTGTRHAGFITYDGPLGQYREYIQGRTTTPLQAGVVYCVSMYVSRGETIWATNNIGIRFTNTQFLRNPCPGTSNSLIDLPPQLNYACAAITDTTQWVRLEWTYTAVGGESWFTIGNFFTSANTDIVTPGGGGLNPYAYYYIDDVSIVAGNCCYADISGPSTFCVNDPPVGLSATGGMGVICNPTVTGTWSGPGITNSTSGTFSPQAAGVGTHTITFTLSCGYSTSLQVSVGPCSGLTVCSDALTGAWTASGGLAPYMWENQTLTQDCSACLFGCLIPPGCAVDVPTWTAMTTGTSIPAPSGYPIRVTDAAGTQLIIASAADVQPCLPCPTISVTISAQSDVQCAGGTDGSATVSASGGSSPYSFSWSPGGLGGPVQNALTNTTYTVTAIDADGCTGTTTVIIGAPTALTVTIVSTQDASCAGNDGVATASASGGTGTLVYAWAPGGQGTAVATGLAPGQYTVTVTDGNGCTSTATAEIVAADGPVINEVTNTPTACGTATGTITVTATGSGLQYSIDGGSTYQANGTFTGLTEGPYTVVVADGNGCTSTATTDIVAADGPVINEVTSTPTECGTPTGTLTVAATGSGLQYSIDGGSTFQASSAFTGLAEGPYTVVVADGSGCTTSAQTTVSSLDGPVIDQITTTAPSCGASDGTITVAATGNGLMYSADGGTTWQASNTFTGLGPGSWVVMVEENGCTATTTVQLNPDGGPTIGTQSSDPLCNGSTDGSITITASGTPPFMYSVNGGATFIDNGMFTGLQAGGYSVVVTDAGGCATNASVSLGEPPPLSVSVTTTSPSCMGMCNGTAQATVSGGTPGAGYLYAWPGGGAPTASSVADALCAGMQQLTVTDGNGCTVSVSFTLTAPQQFSVDEVQVTQETCPGMCDGTLLVIAPGAAAYSINDGPPQPAPLFTGLCAGLQTAGAFDANGCMGTAMVVIGSGAPVHADFTVVPYTASPIRPEFTFTNTSTGAVSFLWDFGPHGTSTESDPVLTLPEAATTFVACLTAMNATGCSATHCLELHVPPDPTVHVPNTFTPDGDGINDTFRVIADLALNDQFRLDIFDRWGELIYSSTDMTKGWDGGYQGSACMQGVYAWSVQVGAPGTPLQRLRGHVTLIR